MFSESSSFEVYDSRVIDCSLDGDQITIKCYYMKTDLAYIIFEKVAGCTNFNHLKGNTISYIKVQNDGYEIHFINEEIEPTTITAREYRIEWQ